MNAVFRVDSSTAMGTGHVMRCLTLARELGRGGWNCAFICRRLPGDLVDHIAQRQGFRVYVNGEAGSGPGEMAPEDDGMETLDNLGLIAGEVGSVHWLIADHYGIDIQWESVVRAAAGKIMVIDDLMNRRHDCDILLDQNPGDSRREAYARLVPAGCRRLTGPRYFLLRGEFNHFAGERKPRPGPVERVLLSFGGTDPTRETVKALTALKRLAVDDRLKVEADVVAGDGNQDREMLRKMCLESGFATFHLQTSRMAELMLAADLSLGSGGTTSMERCYMGLPTLMVAAAENQVGIARELARIGAGVFMGGSSEVSEATMAGQIMEIAHRPERLREMSVRALEVTDGLGAQRVASHLAGTVDKGDLL